MDYCFTFSVLLLLLLLLLLLFVITFLRGISNCIAESKTVSRVYILAAVLRVQFTARVLLFPTIALYFYIYTFRNMCTVHGMAVLCTSIMSCFPGVLLRYFMSDFEMDVFAPVIAGINFVFTFFVLQIPFGYFISHISAS